MHLSSPKIHFFQAIPGIILPLFHSDSTCFIAVNDSNRKISPMWPIFDCSCTSVDKNSSKQQPSYRWLIVLSTFSEHHKNQSVARLFQMQTLCFSDDWCLRPVQRRYVMRPATREMRRKIQIVRTDERPQQTSQGNGTLKIVSSWYLKPLLTVVGLLLNWLELQGLIWPLKVLFHFFGLFSKLHVSLYEWVGSTSDTSIRIWHLC